MKILSPGHLFDVKKVTTYESIHKLKVFMHRLIYIIFSNDVFVNNLQWLIFWKEFKQFIFSIFYS